MAQTTQTQMLLTTTDTVPYAYEVLGIVHVAFNSRSTTGMKLTPSKPSTQVDEKLTHMYSELAYKAAAMGADAVIGIRLSQVMAAGLNDVQVLLGTAIRWRASAS